MPNDDAIEKLVQETAESHGFIYRKPDYLQLDSSNQSCRALRSLVGKVLEIAAKQIHSKHLKLSGLGEHTDLCRKWYNTGMTDAESELRRMKGE